MAAARAGKTYAIGPATEKGNTLPRAEKVKRSALHNYALYGLSMALGDKIALGHGVKRHEAGPMGYLGERRAQAHNT